LPKSFQGDLNGAGHKVGIVVSRFNDFITGRLLEGAVDCLVRQGGKDEDIEVGHVPGAFEMPMAARRMVGKKKYDAVLCLGAVIRGGTPHFEYVAGECTKGLAMVSMEYSVPVSFGVLTVDPIEQAVWRSGTKAGNKGEEAAMSAIEMVSLMGKLD